MESTSVDFMPLITAASIAAYKKDVNDDTTFLSTSSSFCKLMEPKVAAVKKEIANLLSRHKV